MVYKNKFYEAAATLPMFENMLSSVPKSIADAATEIRIRAGKPIIIETIDSRYVCGSRCIGIDEIYSCVKNFCDYSIHSFQRELSEGWITLKGGHRAGISGTAHNTDGNLTTIKDISSLNIRIAREHTGISDILFYETALRDNFKGLIIAGPPLCGKTTMLRDYCRNCGNNFKTALIDERSEISAVYKGIPQNDVGANTDILNNYTKKTGIEQAIRVLSPEIVVCDEIGNEIEDIINLTSCGVRYVFTVHCRNIIEAENNSVILSLINKKAVNYITFLDNGRKTGKMKGLWFLENGKGIDSCNNGNNLLYHRDDVFCRA